MSHILKKGPIICVILERGLNSACHTEKIQFFGSYRKKVQFFLSKLKNKVQFLESFQEFNSLSHLEKIYWKMINFLSHILKKGSILWVISKKKGSILWVIFFKKGSLSHIKKKKSVSLGHIEKKVQLLESYWKRFNYLSHFENKSWELGVIQKKFNSLSHIQKKYIFES